MVYIKLLHIYTSRFVENLAYNLCNVLKKHFECRVHVRQLTHDDVKKLGVNEYFMIISPQSTLSKSAFNVLKPNTYFIYQTEQLNTQERANKYHNNPSMSALFNKAYQVFDYSQDNILYYPSKYNKQPLFLPFIRNNNTVVEENKTIDILFYGTLNQRRYIVVEVLKQLLPHLNIVVEEKLFGKELQDKIKASKIILNIHNYEHATLETARIAEAENHNVHIISEKTHENELMSSFKNVYFIDELIDYAEKESIDIEKRCFKNIVVLINRLLKTKINNNINNNDNNINNNDNNIKIIENIFYPFKILDTINYTIDNSNNNNLTNSIEKNQNVLIYSCHFTINSMFIINEFLKFSDFDNINTIIVVYSFDKSITTEIIYQHKDIFTKIANKCNIVFLHDNVNKYFDFGKIACGYDYIINNNINFNYVHVINDSIIPTRKIHHIYKGIHDKMQVYDFVGVLETMQIDKHYQSWWLCMTKEMFSYYVQKLVYYNLSHCPQNDVIYKNEVELCNNIIKTHNTSVIYNNILKNNRNIFFDDDKDYNILYKKGFHFVKVKRIKNIPTRPPLNLPDKINYIIKNIH